MRLRSNLSPALAALLPTAPTLVGLTRACDLGRRVLMVRSTNPLVSPSSRLKRPADKLDRVHHAGAVVYWGAQRPVRQIGQPVQAGTLDLNVLPHPFHNSTWEKRSQRISCTIDAAAKWFYLQG
jgi:hypothetical protein